MKSRARFILIFFSTISIGCGEVKEKKGTSKEILRFQIVSKYYYNDTLEKFPSLGAEISRIKDIDLYPIKLSEDSIYVYYTPNGGWTCDGVDSLKESRISGVEDKSHIKTVFSSFVKVENGKKVGYYPKLEEICELLGQKYVSIPLNSTLFNIQNVYYNLRKEVTDKEKKMNEGSPDVINPSDEDLTLPCLFQSTDKKVIVEVHWDLEEQTCGHLKYLFLDDWLCDFQKKTLDLQYYYEIVKRKSVI